MDLGKVDTANHDSARAARIRAIAAGRTDVGRQRSHNEDRLLVETRLDLFVVADGMGGHNAGEVASGLAAASMRNFFAATVGVVVDGPLAEHAQDLPPSARRLVAAVRKANADIYEISSTVEKHKGMGSTIVAAHLDREGMKMHIAHVGDSRCYRIRGGIIEQLTRDHSLISDALAWNPNLTEEQLALLPKNVISRSLGRKGAVDVDIRSDDALPGDLYLLCSDGLSGLVSDQQILESVSLSDDPGENSELLVALANEAGGVDNVTVAIVRVGLDAPQTANATAAGAPEISSSPLGAQEMAALFDGSDEISELIALSVEAADGAAAVPSLCTACGQAIPAGNDFCVQCGAKVAPAS